MVKLNKEQIANITNIILKQPQDIHYILLKFLLLEKKYNEIRRKNILTLGLFYFKLKIMIKLIEEEYNKYPKEEEIFKKICLSVL